MATWLLLCLLCVAASAQRFYNLTAQEIRIDSMLPRFSCSVPLGAHYADSTYTVSIAYPEFIDMTLADIARYKALSADPLPSFPVVSQQIGVSRREGWLDISFSPFVVRDGRWQVLVSFMLDIQSRPVAAPSRRGATVATRASGSGRYAPHSVLATGKWAKIRVSESGVYQLTESLIRQAGFSDLSRVKVYGYGGALQEEILRADYLADTDDLREVPLCVVDGRRLFYAQGPVSWAGDAVLARTRNPYSDYGYYFLTQTDEAPQTVSADEFLASVYPKSDDYHWLYEVDDFAWYSGGRNLYDRTPIAVGASRDYTLPAFPAAANLVRLSVVVTAGQQSVAQVEVDGQSLGTMTVSLGTYDKGGSCMRTFVLPVGAEGGHTVRLSTLSGGPVRLDNLSLTYDAPREAPSLATASFPVPEYVYRIINQDHHADPAADMVIIIPTSQKLLAQAKRLKDFHESHDGLRVNIVPADELYNEFSSGTPDANAYRRYLKMLYDRAETQADMPKYLLLFGDCVWDNRMRTADTRLLDADDYLLCFESDNSFSELYCYVDDGFFCLLDEGEGGNPQASDKLDMAVGRFPVTTEAEAKAMVDKTIAYATNNDAGAWQNTLVFMGDDGDKNRHMADIDETADQIAARYPSYQIRKVMWDAYKRESSATGNSYPEVTTLIKQLQANGALIMDYGGHGRADQLSHEVVLKLTDFQQFRNTHLPLWITASCDVMAFDGLTPTIGEAAVLNAKGGAVAFYGTTRTVQAYYNKYINQYYLRHVLSLRNGQPVTIGEAQRLAKNELVTTGFDRTTNKLQFSLLGDPALALHLPTLQVVVDSINGSPATASNLTLHAGMVTKVAGHIEGAPDFNGIVTATVRDVMEWVTCKKNDPVETDTALVFKDRQKILFSGSDSVRSGRFAFSFAVPRDISYSDATGMMNFHAVSADHRLTAHGNFGRFVLTGSDSAVADSIGPSIYCYLNAPSFANGAQVNTTPYFVAEVTDEDGINATGNGIGHDLLLVIDGDMNKTYVLNDHFSFDFGTYTRGSTYYNIPELAPGPHRLLFRAWDVLNNSSTAELDFTVVRGLEPTLFSVDVGKNPATTSTTFIINHDRTGSDMDVEIDVFDMSGRQLWHYTETGVPTSGAHTVEWDLTLDSGGRLHTGVYLYRASIATDGSKKVSKAKKLIVIGNN